MICTPIDSVLILICFSQMSYGWHQTWNTTVLRKTNIKTFCIQHYFMYNLYRIVIINKYHIFLPWNITNFAVKWLRPIGNWICCLSVTKNTNQKSVKLLKKRHRGRDGRCQGIFVQEYYKMCRCGWGPQYPPPMKYIIPMV